MVTCPFCSESLPVAAKPAERAILAACDHCMNPVVLRSDAAGLQAVAPQGVRDIREIAKGESIGAEVLKAFPKAVERLPVLPEIAHRVMAMTRDPEVSMQDLAEAIMQDQVIALRILQLANSSLYGGLTEIKDLNAACARLGMKNISNTVLAIANGHLYKTKKPAYRDMMQRLWRHALATAHCASQLAIMLAEPGSDTLFVAGLIHDVGMVLLLDVVSQQGSKITAILQQSPELLDEVLESYHALLGFHIVHHWELPAEFAITTFCHEQVEAVPDDSWRAMVHIVALASDLADVSGFGLHESDVSLLTHPSTKFLGLNDMKLASLRVDIEDKLAPLLDIIQTA